MVRLTAKVQPGRLDLQKSTTASRSILSVADDFTGAAQPVDFPLPLNIPFLQIYLR